MNSMFINPQGYSCTLDDAASASSGCNMYRFTLAESPLMFVYKGTTYRTSLSFLTNLGSVPQLFHFIPGFDRDTYPRSYAIHDDGCNRGGLYVWSALLMSFEFEAIPRSEMDEILGSLVPVEGALLGHAFRAKISAPLIWVAVRIGAFLGIGKPGSVATYCAGKARKFVVRWRGR